MQIWYVMELLNTRLPQLSRDLPKVEFQDVVESDAFQILWQEQVESLIFADDMLNLDLMHTKAWSIFQHNRPQSVKALYACFEAFSKRHQAILQSCYSATALSGMNTLASKD